MSEIISIHPIALPSPSVPMSVRVGTRDDIAFMDALQKLHGKALGFFSRKMFEGYIDGGNVLVAETWHGRLAHEITGGTCEGSPHQSVPQVGEPLGYVISRDRYLKRDELGAVFQLCVVPGRERGFIGANLLREVFERSSYGCRLYCCWCAQDLPANKFWEAMGFVPIAYRAGGKARSSQPAARSEDAPLKAGGCKLKATPRIHIFWQKRIRSGDNSTPYWFPAKTEGGAIREDRIILPIPPSLRWTDALPVLEIGEAEPVHPAALIPRPSATRRLPGKAVKQKPTAKKVSRPIVHTPNGIRMAVPAPSSEGVGGKIVAEESTQTKKAKPPRAKRKCDPALIEKARELRDRWMEQLNADASRVRSMGKYDAVRRLRSDVLRPEMTRLTDPTSAMIGHPTALPERAKAPLTGEERSAA